LSGVTAAAEEAKSLGDMNEHRHSVIHADAVNEKCGSDAFALTAM
jgi:hypothetical protein